MNIMDIFSIIIALIVGAAGGFFFSQKMFKKQLADNPPINEKMIRAMYLQMGRKPSESQIKQTMKAMDQYKK